jgi:hypothetical protein
MAWLPLAFYMAFGSDKRGDLELDSMVVSFQYGKSSKSHFENANQPL